MVCGDQMVLCRSSILQVYMMVDTRHLLTTRIEEYFWLTFRVKLYKKILLGCLISLMIYHIVGVRISSIFIGVIKMDYLNRSRIGLYVNNVFPFINLISPCYQLYVMLWERSNVTYLSNISSIWYIYRVYQNNVTLKYPAVLSI